jgi:hypothetical protein
VHDAVGVGDLEVHAAPRFDAPRNEPSDLLQPRADVCLDRRGLLVGENLVCPVLDRLEAADGVDDRVRLARSRPFSFVRLAASGRATKSSNACTIRSVCL